jgi:hypothetical protein
MIVELALLFGPTLATILTYELLIMRRRSQSSPANARQLSPTHESPQGFKHAGLREHLADQEVEEIRKRVEETLKRMEKLKL